MQLWGFTEIFFFISSSVMTPLYALSYSIFTDSNEKMKPADTLGASQTGLFLFAYTRINNRLCPAIRRSVGLCIGPSNFTFFPFSAFMQLWAVFASLLLPKCMIHLFYHCPRTQARDLGLVSMKKK